MTMQMLMADERRNGVQERLQKGRVEGVLAAISSLMNTMNWSIERAMGALNVPENERPQYAALLQKGPESML